MTVAPWEAIKGVQYRHANDLVQDTTGGLLRNPPGSYNQEAADQAVLRKVMDALRK